MLFLKYTSTTVWSKSWKGLKGKYGKASKSLKTEMKECVEIAGSW